MRNREKKLVKDISIDDFSYPLSEDKIAKFPLKQRDKSKLLFYNSKQIVDTEFTCLPDFLTKDNLLIFNDTKVVYARLFFQKQTGSKIEIFCLEPIEPNDFQIAFSQKHECVWNCLVGNNKKWKQGKLSASRIIENEKIMLNAERLQADKDSFHIKFTWDKNKSFAEVMQAFGVIPLPPYLNRQANEQDKQDYQTIYANYEGSVAAPTAGLHFTDKTFEDLKKKNISTCFVTLHVGAGTFKPVTTSSIGEHIMHTENITINKEVIEQIISHAGNIICVGTTSVRTIESLYWYGVQLLENNLQYKEIDIKQWYPYQEHKDYSLYDSLTAVLQVIEKEKLTHIYGQTQLMIAPSYKYCIVNGMVTNFHQPKSTLLLLVSAMIGDKWRDVYQHALDNNYRFLSYGDACLFIPEK